MNRYDLDLGEQELPENYGTGVARNNLLQKDSYARDENQALRKSAETFGWGNEKKGNNSAYVNSLQTEDENNDLEDYEKLDRKYEKPENDDGEEGYDLPDEKDDKNVYESAEGQTYVNENFSMGSGVKSDEAVGSFGQWNAGKKGKRGAKVKFADLDIEINEDGKESQMVTVAFDEDLY